MIFILHKSIETATRIAKLVDRVVPQTPKHKRVGTNLWPTGAAQYQHLCRTQGSKGACDVCKNSKITSRNLKALQADLRAVAEPLIASEHGIHFMLCEDFHSLGPFPTKSSFMHLGGSKEGDGKEGKSITGEWRLCSFEGGLLEGTGKGHFKVVNRNNGQDLLKAKTNVLLDKLHTWSMTTHVTGWVGDLLSLWSDHPVRFLPFLSALP